MRTVWLIYARAGSLILLMSNQNSRIFIQRIISKSIIYVWTGHNRLIKPIDERPCSRTSYNIHPKNWAKFKNTISSCEIILSFFYLHCVQYFSWSISTEPHSLYSVIFEQHFGMTNFAHTKFQTEHKPHKNKVAMLLV